MKQFETQQKNGVAAIKITNFSKRYKGRDNYAVKDVSFEVQPGEFHGFIGANGAGKTTTIKSLIGAYAKYDGTVEIFGHLNKTKEAKLKMGYIPEAANFPRNLTAVQYIAHMANLSGMSMKAAREFAKKELTAVGLGNLLKAKPMTFSSGQKKKVLLAQALVANPDVLVMDEPAANLDPKARAEFFETLKELQQRGKAIFISSHILAELEHFITTVTILDGGRVVYSGQKDDLLSNEGLSYKFAFENKKDTKTFQEWVKAQKLDSWKEQDFTIVQLKERKYLDKAVAFIAKEKLNVNTLTINKKTLQEAYDFYVRKGSNDTSSKLDIDMIVKGGN